MDWMGTVTANKQHLSPLASHLSPRSVKIRTKKAFRSASSHQSSLKTNKNNNRQTFQKKLIWTTERLDRRNKWLRYDEACVDDKISHPLSSDVGGRGNLVIFYREARVCITSSQNFDCVPHSQPGNPE